MGASPVTGEIQNTEKKRRPRLTPVAALTRCHPDISGLTDTTTLHSDVIRQGVRIGTTGILLPYLEKAEIIELDSFCPIPNTPMWFMGMINNRGNLLPVFDLKLFMQADVHGPSRWLMVLGGGSRAAGLCIDTLPVTIANPEQMDIARIDAQTGIPDELRPYLAGSYIHDGLLWMDLTFDKLFQDLCAGF